MFNLFQENERLQPNFDWSNALFELQTILPKDLFHNLQNASEISLFVKQVFCQYPQITGQLLTDQSQLDDVQFELAIEKQIQGFIKQAESSPIESIQIKPINEEQVLRQLRIFRRCHSAVIALLELENKIMIESSSLRISILAEQLINAAYTWSYQYLCKKYYYPVDDDNNEALNLVILAMGKLGGRELNFSSDIDLIFFYPQDGEAQGISQALNNSSMKLKKITHANFFRKISQQVIKLLDQITEDSFVFRVDMRLRPYGSSGVLAMSFDQAEDYYQQQGREWERFALLRARAITGNAKEQKLLDDIIRPFSFRRYIDYGVFDSIRQMKEMIQQEIRRQGDANNIKLGLGGIREIEFIVQSMQLIQGGREPRLREKSTLKVLPLLVDSNLLSEDVAKYLSVAYRFLRKVENTVQEFAEEQTHSLPQQEEQQSALSKVMGYKSWSDFLQVIQKHQKQVHKHFNDVFNDEEQSDILQDDFYLSLSNGQINTEKLYEYFIEKNSVDSQISLLTLKQSENFILELNHFLDDKKLSSLSVRGIKRLKVLLPHLLANCLLTENPDITLKRLLIVIKAILKRTVYLELLSENPPILTHLVDLTSSSLWVVERLSEYPVLLDELLYPSRLYQPLQSTDLEAELNQFLLRVDPLDEEALLDSLRVFKKTNELRVAAALLTERINISQVNRYLTQLSEVILNTSFKICWSLLANQYGFIEIIQDDFLDCGFAIIGYGKLGGFELGFGSDLDLVFLFDRSVEKSIPAKRSMSYGRFYTRLAQKLIHFLSTKTNSGLLYQVDMRLRPSGDSGLLVSHLQAYYEYQKDSAWTWEHQALVRARFITGDASIQKKFFDIRNQILAQPHDLEKLKLEVKNMRYKMREQNKTLDLKQAPGGMIDIEFLAQFFCLADIGDKVWPNNTVNCLQFSVEEKMLDKKEATILIDNYRLFRNEINRDELIKYDGKMLLEPFEKQLQSVLNIWKNIFGDIKGD